jgi:DHA2 family multidrug resistance protein
MAVLDIQVVAAALPRMAVSLHMPLDVLSWVQTTYLITEVIAIAVSGRLARALSTRWLFTAACAGFVITSAGCALSGTFTALIVWRTVQGLFAGSMIPSVFAAGYKMFPKEHLGRAILIAGVVAMIAPCVGPAIGGYVTAAFAWNWLFAVNVPIGIVVALVVAANVDVDRPERSAWRRIDVLACAGLTIGLAALEIAMKVGPEDRWSQARDLGLVVLALASLAVCVQRCRIVVDPLVDLTPLRRRSFAAACAGNFTLGVALFGSLYVLPLFLGFVRYRSPLDIGITMTVMGAAQLLAAPFATLADRRLPAWSVAAFGFALFALGAFTNAFQTPRTDFAGLALPQLLRGAALLFCLLPITNVALDDLPVDELSNASALLNLMRNLGGAIGIGLVDTIVNARPAALADALTRRLVAGDAATAAFVGIPRDLLAGVDIHRADPADIAFVTPIIARAAATIAFNEAWIALGIVLALSLLGVGLLRRSASPTSLVLVERPA